MERIYMPGSSDEMSMRSLYSVSLVCSTVRPFVAVMRASAPGAPVIVIELLTWSGMIVMPLPPKVEPIDDSSRLVKVADLTPVMLSVGVFFITVKDSALSAATRHSTSLIATSMPESVIRTHCWAVSAVAAQNQASIGNRSKSFFMCCN